MAGSPAGPRRVKVPAAPNGRYVGLVLLFSTHTGEPLAIYPDGIVQRMRVGAISGLAAKYLARPDARDVALLGTGWQAGGQGDGDLRGQKHQAHPLLQPASRTARGVRSGNAGETRHRNQPGREAREAVSGADIVMCATNSMEPVFAREWLEPGMHVSSL